MRRSELRASPETAYSLFQSVPVAHLVVDGPEVRPVHPVVVDGLVCWHGAPKGEKAGWVGRSAVLSAHEIVAEIPSYLRHPERACPATTYYRSAEVRGRIVAIDDPHAKLAVLERLLARFQPEGGYRPLSVEDPMYAGAIRALGVYALDGEPVARAKLGQSLSDPDRHAVLEGLWKRGAPGDDRAIESIWQAAPEGASVAPRFRGPRDTRLLTRIPDARVGEAVALVRDEYWNTDWDDAVIAGAMTGSEIWVGAEHDGRLVATARAMTDGSKMTYVGDVGVHPDFRRGGVGSAVMRLLLDHGRVRGTRWTSLRTRDAVRFYERMGFTYATNKPGVVDLILRPTR
ncbi:MAG: GNAT family N-acetyltransferase [Alphaproteobacteria bacterium]|nr:GNAT family N-acetyltransferase [Alphaproteobacteria bacterium]